MKAMQKAHLFGLLAIMGLAMLFSGCSTKGGYVTLSYLPQSNVVRAQGAELRRAQIIVIDQRAIRDRVSAKKNMQGVEVAPIIATNDIGAVLTRALESELSNRGYVVDAGGAVIEVKLQKLYTDYQVNIASRRANTESLVNVRVMNVDGDELFQKIIREEWSKPGMLMSAKRVNKALDTALREMVQALFRDPAFLEAVNRGIPI